MKNLLFILLISIFISCDAPKKVIKNPESKEESIIVNTNAEAVLAGDINFDSDENISIKSAIIKNVLADKAGAYIGHQMDKLAVFFDNQINYSELLRAGEGLILEINTNENFYFDTGESKLNGRSKKTIDVVVAALKKYPNFNMVIEMHSDANGNDALNLELSHKRGLSVYDYFTDNGIDAERMQVSALGENYPKNANISYQDIKDNRRIAFGFYASEDLKSEAREMTR